MLKLHMTFFNADGKTTRYTPKISRDDLSAQEVRSVMDAIVGLGFFEKNGIKQCTGVAKARYVETIETELFDLT